MKTDLPFLSVLSARLGQSFIRAIALLLLGMASGAAVAQVGTSGKPTVSLADSLRSAGSRQVHIFYVHGIAAGGSGDFDSWSLRKGICDFVKDCLSPAGEMDGEREYADQDEFKLDAPPPELRYLGEPIWKTSEEWNASAPFVIHWKLARKTGQAIYVDEIHWWPVVFPLKCREIVARDADLTGPDVGKIGSCAELKEDGKAKGRYVAYDWITPQEAARLEALPQRGARINRGLKQGMMDWGFSDAVMSLGPLRKYLLDGIRQLILKSVEVSATGVRGAGEVRADEQYVIVSHSLGSYLMFSALDIGPAAPEAPAVREAGGEFEQVLARTGLVYFFANQLRFLELADVDGTSNMASHLEAWARFRCAYLKTLPGAAAECQRPEIVALNDPSDLLTWELPELKTVEVHNVKVKNAIHWFWVFESPTKAHNNYAKNKGAIEQMLRLSKP